MNEFEKLIAKTLIRCKSIGMPGGDSVDISDRTIIETYMMVLAKRGMIIEDLQQAVADVVDRQYFPRPFDVAEACMPFKAKRDQAAINEENRRLALRARGIDPNA